MTRYLDRVLAGESPSASEWNEHLVEFHGKFDDVMYASASLLRTADGETSYELLARRAFENVPDAAAVLDIGCGDGTLLVEIEKRFGTDVRLAGVDLSAREIERARARLPRAELHVANAAQWAFATATHDIVVAHLSLRVMSGINAVLTGARNALRESGALEAVIELPSQSDSLGRMLGAAAAEVKAAYPRFVPSVPDWREAFDVAGFTRRLVDAGFANEVSVEYFDVAASVSADQLMRVCERMYPFGLLADDLRRKVRDALLRDAALDVNAEGLTTISMSLALIHARV